MSRPDYTSRARFSETFKAAVIAESREPGVNVAALARRHGVQPALLYQWRKLAGVAPAEPVSLIPVSIAEHNEAPPRPDDASPSSWLAIELKFGARLYCREAIAEADLLRVLRVLQQAA